MNFSKNLRQLMTERSVTQVELSSAIGVSVRSIQAYTSGTQDPKLTIAYNIAQFFEVSLDSLCH